MNDVPRMRVAFSVATFAISTLLSSIANAQNMVPSNILTRVFSLKVGDERASGFTIEVDGKQYLITARHALESLPAAKRLEVFRDGK